MIAINQATSDRREDPVTLTLLKKLYLPKEEDEKYPGSLGNIRKNRSTLQGKVNEYLQGNDKRSPQQQLNSLSFTDKEINEIDEATVSQ